MPQATVSFRIDSKLKEEMDQTCKDMGLTMTSAFTMFATKVVRERRIPFEVSADPFYSKENIAELERRVANLNAGISILKAHELIEVD